MSEHSFGEVSQGRALLCLAVFLGLTEKGAVSHGKDLTSDQWCRLLVVWATRLGSCSVVAKLKIRVKYSILFLLTPPSSNLPKAILANLAGM